MLKSGFGLGGIFSETIREFSQTNVTLPDLSRFSYEEKWMFLALKTSMRSIGTTSPNPGVGCVIIKNSSTVAVGFTQPWGGLHAEKAAISKLKRPEILENSEVFCTLEPCSHFGKQPPCVDLFLQYKPARITIGIHDPDFNVNGEGIKKLVQANIDVKIGPLGKEIKAWLVPFLHFRIHQKPLVACKWAQSLDGKNHDYKKSSQWITGETARAYGHWLRQHYDVVLVGIGTFLSDLPNLTVRECAFINTQPVRCIFDPNGKILTISAEEKTKIKDKFSMEKQKFIYFSKAQHGKNIKNDTILKNTFDVAILNEDFDTLDLANQIKNNDIFLAVRGRPIQSIYVEGGPTLIANLFSNGYCDVFHMFIAPFILGGLASNELKNPPTTPKFFSYISNTRLGEDILVEGISDKIKKLLQ